MIQSTLLYVRKNIRELLIHMICGASQSDILLRISAEVLIINLVGVVVSSLIFMSLRTTLVFMLTGIATAVIAILPVMVSIKRKPLIMQIKEEKAEAENQRFLIFSDFSTSKRTAIIILTAKKFLPYRSVKKQSSETVI